MTDEIFPLDKLQPKKETGVDKFLAKYPEFDGRGVIVGIMDTLVDASVDGLQVTSEGKPKMLSVMDCSGSGDVQMSVVRTLAEDNTMLALSQRTLKVPTSWSCPSGQFRVGIKPLYHLFGKALQERIKKKRKEKFWDPESREQAALARRRLDADEKNTNMDTLSAKWQREECLAAVHLLKQYDEQYEDLGQTVDCVLFHNGSHWKVCVDTSFSGDLESCKLMGTYADTRDIHRFSDDDLMSYVVNVHDEGQVLELCVASNSHGTHVAGITAACFPEEPAKNGVAPGAQLVSLGIADGRLGGGSMETGTSLQRALKQCVQLGVQVINFSFGEATHLPNQGRILKYLEETVWKYGILFVSSAGNNGPALSTAGCPGATSKCCIGIGAYVSAEMMASMYSLRERLPPTLYPWSSNGPSDDGSLGPSVSAPGAAITCIPKWTLNNAQLMNGTSMSSPHATGCITLLLSALVASEQSYSVFSVRQAVENTALLTAEQNRFATGHGLLQVDAAYEHLRTYQSLFESGLLRYDVHVKGFGAGVYLREAVHVHKEHELSVTVRPVMHEDTPNDCKQQFNRRFVLCCDAEWVQHPKHLQMCYSERTINIRVDARALSPNTVHFTQLVAYDSSCVEAGSQWRVPITVIQADRVAGTKPFVAVNDLLMRPAQRHRHFVIVPDTAAWAVLTIQAQKDDCVNGRFVIHTVQLLPDSCYRSNECHKMVTLSDSGEYKLPIRVLGGRTMELCICKWWAALGVCTINYTLHFHSLTPHTALNNLNFMSCETVKKLTVKCDLQPEDLQPTINLRTFCLPLRATESDLRVLGVRDTWHENRHLWALTLTYTFTVAKQTELVPSWPGLSDYLYESELDSQVWMVFTANKQFCFGGDTYPQRYYGKVAKGEYKIRVCFRHESEAMLEQIKDLPCVLLLKLAQPVTLDCYSSLETALRPASAKMAVTPMAVGDLRTIYVRALADDKWPKVNGMRAGCYLSGHMLLCKDELGRRVTQFPCSFIFTEPVSRKVKAAGAEAVLTVPLDVQAKVTHTPTMIEQLRDTKIAWLTKFKLDTKAAKLYEELKTEHAAHLPVYVTYLQRLQDNKSPKWQSVLLSVADKLLSLVDMQRLHNNMNTKFDMTEKPDMKKSELDEQKAAVLSALLAKGHVLLDIYLHTQATELGLSDLLLDQLLKGAVAVGKGSANTSAPTSPSKHKHDRDTADSAVLVDTDTDKDKDTVTVSDEQGPCALPPPQTSLQELRDLYMIMLPFADASQTNLFAAKLAVAHGHFARALLIVQKMIEEQPTKTLDQLQLQLCVSLGWSHVQQQLSQSAIVRFPSEYRLF